MAGDRGFHQGFSRGLNRGRCCGAAVRVLPRVRSSRIRGGVLGPACGVEPGSGIVEPTLAQGREGLAALPEGQRVLECGAPSFETRDDVGELVTGLLEREVLGSGGQGVQPRVVTASGVTTGVIILGEPGTRPR